MQEAYTTMGAVNEVAPAPVAVPAVYEALRQSFSATFGVELVETPIAPEEWRLAQRLQTTKYATDAWNLDGAAAWRQRQSVASV